MTAEHLTFKREDVTDINAGTSINRYKFDFRPTEAEIEFDWLITNQCNFNCVYCYPQIKAHLKEPPHFERKPIEETAGVFDRLGKVAHIIISGGEPFMYPKFVDFASLVTQKHFISIYTNFSTSNVYEFADRVDPYRVPNVFPALHVQEREKRGGERQIADYVKKVLHFQNKGFNTHGVYVLHPSLLDRFEDDIEKLREAGVSSMNIKIYKGWFEGKIYPEGYTNEEKEKIRKFPTNYPHNTPYVLGERNFIGKPCYAGMKFLRIAPNGEVTRCASIPRMYGNIYNPEGIKLDEAPQPCTAKRVLTLTNCLSYLVEKPDFAQTENQ